VTSRAFAHPPEKLELKAALDPGAQNSDPPDDARSEVFGGDRPGRGRADVGEMPLIEEDGQKFTRLPAEEEHEAVR